MRTQVTIDVELEQLACVRCGKTTLVMPHEFRRLQPYERPDPEGPPWRATGWSHPEGWRRWSMPGADAAASCPDCWDDVERSGRAFLQLVRVRDQGSSGV